MPKLACPCGFVHNLSPIPDDGWHTLRDRDFAALYTVNTPTPDVHAEVLDLVSQESGSLYECPQCGRIMWEKPGEDKFTVYRVDS